MHASFAIARKPILVALALGAAALALLLILTRAGGPTNAFASSHSEAPLISQDPRADNTDLYAFVSPDNTNTVTMIANYIPLEAPVSGPNFYSFDDSVLYELKVDNTGDGVPDLGSIFDLAGLRPFNPFHLLPLAADAGRDALKNYNTHSIEIQVPISELTGFSNTTIGIYASASRQKARILDPSGQVRSRGPWVQISRLGNPLINEVVIPLGDKDDWNREDPADDQQLEHYYSSPEVSRLENLLHR